MPQEASDLERSAFQRVLLLGIPRCGKAQPVDTPVLTPSGWRRLGDLIVGDQVIGSTGRPIQVTGVFPQGVKSVMRVVADDGATTVACTDHLWYTTTKIEVRKGAEGKVRTTGEIAKTLGNRETGMHYLPRLTAPVRFEARGSLPMEPYFLGLLLGDASMAHSCSICFTKGDPELRDSVLIGFKSLGDEAQERFRNDRCPDVVLRNSRTSNTCRILKELGLYGGTARDKFIPEMYLFASPQDRLSLLQGLCDTDGSATDRAQIEYSTTSSQLAGDVVFLARSLGARAKLSKRETSCQTGAKCTSWRISISFFDGTCPFRLKRKADRLVLKPKLIYRQRIDSIEPAGLAECVCIAVATSDSLYITSDFLLTHNTTTSVMSLAETYGKGYVVCCGDKNALEPAQRRTKDFAFDIVRDENDMETVIQISRDGVSGGEYHWVLIDDLTVYAMWLENELREQSARRNKTGEADMRQVSPAYCQRLCSLVGRFCDLKAHVVFTGHYQEAPTTLSGQRKKTGFGVWPLLMGQARDQVPLRIRDTIFMEKEEGGRRVFNLNPTGVYTPAGCRSVDQDDLTIDASFKELERVQAETNNKGK